MEVRTALLLFMGLAIGFAGGFFVANALNKSQVADLQSKLDLQSQNQPATTSNELSQEEVSTKIKEADANPQNFEYQRDLGIALYQYSQSRQDPKLLPDVERLLSRAHALQPNDFNVTVAAAVVNFDLAQINKDPKANEKSRTLLEQALKSKPNDANLLADLGATYMLLPPENLDKANHELEKALEIDPKNQRAVQFMATLKAKEGNTDAAKKYLGELKSINSQNPAISGIEAQIKKEN